MSRWFFLLLLCKAALLLLALFFFPLPLSPDEAQYWVWSKHLSWGYYSKPAGIAWTLWAATFLGGDNPFFVRLPSLLFSFGIPLLIRLTAKAAFFSESQASLAGLVFAFSPIGFALSYLAITDVGMLFFWSCALYQLTLLCFQNRGSPLLMGGFIALSCLFKWTGFLFLPVAFWALWKENKTCLHLFWKPALLSAVSLLPSLIWNWEHDFATFRHVAGQAFTAGDGAEVLKGNFFSFLLSQAALFGPLFFAFAFQTACKKNFSKVVSFFTGSSIAFLVVYALISLGKKIQGNWVDFAFIGLSPLAALGINRSKKRAFFGFFVNAFIVLGAVFSPLFPLPYKSLPLKNLLGWNEIEHALEAFGYNSSSDYLLSNTYQGVSELSFYNPKKELAYYLPLEPRRRNQFSYFPSYLEEKKEEGFFIFFEQSPHIDTFEKTLLEKEKSLTKYFVHVSYLGKYPLYERGGVSVKNAYFFRVKHAKGEPPKESGKF